MKKVLLMLSAVVAMNVQAASVQVLNLGVKDAVQVNCKNSMPVLSGAVVTCEVLCNVSVERNYENVEDNCDQGGCSGRAELVSTEVKVVSLVNGQTIFQNLVFDSSNVSATVEFAKNVAAKSCTKVEFVK